ncbi:hypothetical protein [Stenotrophomonas sp. SORGH_AS_0321]|nr:hypothetical protein [Stenotrophomonas sp. SORGH_AS_0321]
MAIAAAGAVPAWPQAPYTRGSINAVPITYTENVYATFLKSDGT